jgi:predicted signal transduction protein with EAL and GGDEF domain
VGDGLLVNVAHRIRSCLRNEDVAARLGGDEFAALLRDVVDEDAARRTAQRIAAELSRPVHVAGVTVDTGASVGLAIARTPVDYDSLLRRADTALYIAKANGKGHWREYREGMISPIRRRSDLRVELENAMRDDTLALHYQPIVDLASGRPVGFEALIRFERDGGGSIPPQELIRIAEENGLIVPLGDWVIRRALSDLPQLSSADAGRRPYVSVNVSPNQLRHTGFADTVLSRLREGGVDPSRLVLEITERVMVAEDAQAWGYLEELRGHGVRVAIDDYGTGCASLSYLRQPSIDVVKIDRSFLNHVETDRDRALLEAVVNLTVQLGLMQIAEGIETEAVRDALLALGCRYGQGFYYSPPVPLPTVVAWAGAQLPVATS